MSLAFNALINSFEEGTTYISIRSSAFPNGKIRGFYTEIVSVPEPAAMTMLGAGCWVLGLLRRRK